MKLNKILDEILIPFWRTPEAKGAKSYFYGKVVGDMNGKEQGDLVLTQKGDMFKFIHGSKNTSKQPYLKLVKKITYLNGACKKHSLHITVFICIMTL